MIGCLQRNSKVSIHHHFHAPKKAENVGTIRPSNRSHRWCDIISGGAMGTHLFFERPNSRANGQIKTRIGGWGNAEPIAPRGEKRTKECILAKRCWLPEAYTGCGDSPDSLHIRWGPDTKDEQFDKTGGAEIGTLVINRKTRISNHCERTTDKKYRHFAQGRSEKVNRRPARKAWGLTVTKNDRERSGCGFL